MYDEKNELNRTEPLNRDFLNKNNRTRKPNDPFRAEENPKPQLKPFQIFELFHRFGNPFSLKRKII